jgi:hypothetical protein
MASGALPLMLVLGLTPGPASAGDSTEEQEEQDQPARSSVAPPIVIGSVALASLTTSVVFTLRSAQAARSLAADLDARVQYDHDDRRLHVGRRDAIAAASMFAVTAVVGALAVATAVRPRTRARRASLSAGLGPGGGALVLTVGF